MKIGEKRYEVDFNFITVNGRTTCMNMQMGFETEAEALAWAKENTSDGKVQSYERIG